MHWFFLGGGGSSDFAGVRPSDDAANGNAVMYDAVNGKILAFAGAKAFARSEYSGMRDTVLITIQEPGQQVQTRVVGNLNVGRVYGNAMAMPDGKVAVVGGALLPLEFDDTYAIFDPGEFLSCRRVIHMRASSASLATPLPDLLGCVKPPEERYRPVADSSWCAAEIWDPETEEWTLIEAQHSEPRTYHSTGVLLKDGRILHGGGGLCGNVNCGGNHLDAEIFSPPYLFNSDGSLAPRPTVSLNTETVGVGGALTVTSSEPLMMISLIRYSSVTHSTNTDQRRIELCGPYSDPCPASPATVELPDDGGIVIGGYWMLFGVNHAGVPSVATSVLVN